jgi:hypothetical protein
MTTFRALITTVVLMSGCASSTQFDVSRAQDEIRIAAFQYIIARSTSGTDARPLCFVLTQTSHGIDGDDPSAAVMSRLRRLYPTARPRSECTISRDRDPSLLRQSDRPILFNVSRVDVDGTNTAVFSISFYVHPMAGGGYRCYARRIRHAWSITECPSEWIT